MAAARRLALGLVLLLAGARPDLADGLAVVGATVLDGSGAAALKDAVVVTEGERIKALGVRAVVPIPKGVTIVDGRGRWVAPRRGAGPLTPGGAADFLILDGDPGADPGALETPFRIVKGGRLLTPDHSSEKGR